MRTLCARKGPVIRHALSAALAAALAVALVAPALTAQAPPADSRQATRVQLQSLAETLERLSLSPAYSDRTRGRARADLDRVRLRLVEGDFSPGQRIQIRVESEGARFDSTVTVLDSVIVDIPGIRRIGLRGVLRSELEARLATEVAVVVRNPQVTARPLMRVAVFGDVASPGFHAVPAETLIDQLLTMSGSVSQTAVMQSLRFMRADTVLYDGPAVLAAIAQGRTLDALNLRDGDALVVPRGSPPWDRPATIGILSMVLAPLLTVLVIR